MKEPLLSELRTHLEFLGYTVLVDEDGDIRARHERHFNSVVTSFQGGLLFVVGFGGAKIEESKTDMALRELNTFNAGSGVTIGYLNEGGGVVLTAWYPLPYNKACLSTFIEQFHREQTRFAGTKILDLTRSEKDEGKAETAPVVPTIPAPTATAD